MNEAEKQLIKAFGEKIELETLEKLSVPQQKIEKNEPNVLLRALVCSFLEQVWIEANSTNDVLLQTTIETFGRNFTELSRYIDEDISNWEKESSATLKKLISTTKDSVQENTTLEHLENRITSIELTLLKIVETLNKQSIIQPSSSS